MNLNKDKTFIASIILEFIFVIILVFVMFYGVIIHKWHIFFMALLTLGLTSIPFIGEYYAHKKSIYIPYSFVIAILVFIFASMLLGEIYDYYYKLFFWDKILHFSSGILLSVGGFYIIHIFNIKSKGNLISSSFLIALFSFCFSITIGSLWELFEFVCDTLFKTHMEKSGLVDTMTDILTNTGGALFATLSYYFYKKKKKQL